MQKLKQVFQFLQEHNFKVLFFLSIGIWVYLFRGFIGLELSQISDARPYYEHFRFFVDNIGRGVYPLWDPTRCYGVPNDLFLRRIGEFNPLYIAGLILVKAGFLYEYVYRWILSLYFLGGAFGFYKLSLKLIKNQGLSFIAFVLLIFSSMGTHLYYDFLILLFVPFVWFFYFLVSFIEKPSRVSLIGIVFTLIIIVTTYIPFYFLTIILTFLLSYVIVFPKRCWQAVLQIVDFIKKNVLIVTALVIILALFLIPGIMLYLDGANENIILPKRHGVQAEQNTLTVNEVMHRDPGAAATIRPVGFFSNLQKYYLGKFYIPIFAFVIFLSGLFTRINKRLILYLVWGFILMIFSSPEVGTLNNFLREKIFFYKYLRNLHFFLEVVIWPVAILFLVELLGQLIKFKPQTKKEKIVTLSYVALVHGGFAAFLMTQGSIVFTTYLTIFLSFLFMVLYFSGIFRHEKFLLLILFILAVAQPLEVYNYLYLNAGAYGPIKRYSKDYLTKNLSFLDLTNRSIKGDANPVDVTLDDDYKFRLYLTTKHVFELYRHIDFDAFRDYISSKFIIYDNVQLVEGPINYDEIEDAIVRKKNLAFIHSSDKLSRKQADLINSQVLTKQVFGNKIEVLEKTVNTVKIRTHFSSNRFLVFNDAYYTGWRAYINGELVPIIRANGAFKGLWVPTGEAVVHFKYGAPWRHIFGFSGIIVSNILLILLFVGGRKELFRLEA